MRLDRLTVKAQEALQAAQALAQRNSRPIAFLIFSFAVAFSAWAQDLTFSARVDKTSVNIGDPVTLTIILGGDLSGIQIPAFQFPEEFAVLARIQSTSFSVRAGAMERSTSLNFVLVPQHAGTFRLGPFQIQHHKKALQTEPIEITVNKPAIPPQLQSHGERFTL